MRRFPRSLLAAAAFTFAAVSHASDTPKIDQASLLKRIEKKDTSMLILDVRTPEEFAAGHVPGAINIPYTHLPSRISEVADAADKDIVLYCTIGVRAEKGAERLRENGFQKLLHLDGDMKAWETQKRPLEK
ncbi:rhodanese-like domain-containing protein [Peristeroidobacter agariperforans]|uniref:rhodanese-like domain-containing protein n=1 Tax=Peristeroidobacter agariperforans TaxID=268404 RepID=UPI00101C55EE|nr:rhodanese-like domain-containing protein [Peristeroidobacter agariperforans]